ncbi:uncharacterized protein LOC114867138 [Betta splendens]|uniref:Uncharacterized protein LOC114867138 n=1 Tax=Betta splendens TaxID=158456 RepID=A0A6P7P588_BETSP|nr:uncharacterized protein LOC114867138 [Betta splendens]
MAEYITDLKVSVTEQEETELRGQGYTVLPENLNAGGNGNRIYLWYKKGHGSTISRIQFSFHSSMTSGLHEAGYRKINKNLNEGTDGDTIYLWYFSGSLPSDVPITDLAVALNAEDEAKWYKAGYQRLACDLNRNAGGNGIYLFLKRAKPVYIRAIDASGNFDEDVNKFQKGFIRVDEDTNREAGGNTVFIWYQLTTDDKQALHGPLEISITDNQYASYESQGYKSVNQDLNQGTGGNRVFLWYKKDVPKNPIRDLSVIVKQEVDPFEKAGIKVINKNLNEGTKGVEEFLCFAESRL